MEVRVYDIVGFGGEVVPCVSYDVGAERVAVVLPGRARAGSRVGGSPARPDLYYTRALLVEHEYNVLEVWWDGDTCPDPPDAWCRENATAAIAAAGDERVRLLVGRSLGTIALAGLSARADLASLWIAPLTYMDHVRESLASWRGPALVVAGEADDGFVPVDGVETVLVPGGDHALMAAHAHASVRALADVVDHVRAWLLRLDTA